MLFSINAFGFVVASEKERTGKYGIFFPCEISQIFPSNGIFIFGK